MKAIIGLFTGAFAGGVVGYFWTLVRCLLRVADTAADHVQAGLGQGFCIVMAPIAPDTIIIAVLGSLVGLVIGSIFWYRQAREEAPRLPTQAREPREASAMHDR